MTIDEVSAELQINKPTLRYWESIGLLPKVPRDASGYRQYREEDISWLFYIQSLRKAGLPINQLKKFLSTYRQNADPETRKQMLIEQRNSLLEQQRKLQQTLNYLNFKIDNFGTVMLNYENEKLAYNQAEKKTLNG